MSETISALYIGDSIDPKSIVLNIMGGEARLYSDGRVELSPGVTEDAVAQALWLALRTHMPRLVSVEDHDRRVTELLQHNNELLQRARDAEAGRRDAERAILAAASLAATLAKMMPLE